MSASQALTQRADQMHLSAPSMDDGVGPGLFSVAMRVAAEGELMAMQRAPSQCHGTRRTRPARAAKP